jgi:hypothetical protein
MKHNIGGCHEIVAAMVAGSVHKKQDEVLGIFVGQDVHKNLEAFRIRRRHDQIDASSVLWADSAIQIDVFTNELGGNLRPDADWSPARSRAVHPAETRFVGEHDAQAATPPGGSPPGFSHSIWKLFF